MERIYPNNMSPLVGLKDMIDKQAIDSGFDVEYVQPVLIKPILETREPKPGEQFVAIWKYEGNWWSDVLRITELGRVEVYEKGQTEWHYAGANWYSFCKSHGGEHFYFIYHTR